MGNSMTSDFSDFHEKQTAPSPRRTSDFSDFPELAETSEDSEAAFANYLEQKLRESNAERKTLKNKPTVQFSAVITAAVQAKRFDTSKSSKTISGRTLAQRRERKRKGMKPLAMKKEAKGEQDLGSLTAAYISMPVNQAGSAD